MNYKKIAFILFLMAAATVCFAGTCFGDDLVFQHYETVQRPPDPPEPLEILPANQEVSIQEKPETVDGISSYGQVEVIGMNNDDDDEVVVISRPPEYGRFRPGPTDDDTITDEPGTTEPDDPSADGTDVSGGSTEDETSSGGTEISDDSGSTSTGQTNANTDNTNRRENTPLVDNNDYAETHNEIPVRTPAGAHSPCNVVDCNGPGKPRINSSGFPIVQRDGDVLFNVSGNGGCSLSQNAAPVNIPSIAMIMLSMLGFVLCRKK